MSQAVPGPPHTAPFGQDYPHPKSSGLGCLLGCASVGLALVLICGGLIWYASVNAARWGTDIAASFAKQTVDASEIRDADKTVVKAQIDRVADGFKEGKITGEELGTIFEKVLESPLFSVLVIYGLEHEYINDPNLPAEEKAKAERTLQRIARGCVEGKITTNDLQGPLSNVSQTDPNQPQQQKQVSKEDLKKCLEDLKKLADDKEIPDEPYELNVGAEVKRIVDEALPGKLP